MRWFLGLILLVAACGPPHRDAAKPDVTAAEQPAPPPALVPIAAVTVVHSVDEAAALQIRVPPGFDFTTQHLVAIPMRLGDGSLVAATRTETTEAGLSITVELPDPDPPPCCGASGCWQHWEERQGEPGNDGHVLVAIEITDLPVSATVEHAPTPPCAAALPA